MLKKLAAIALLVVVLSSPGLLAQDARSVAKKVFPSVVEIVLIDAGGKISRLGSGFFVLPDVIVTNYHVVDGPGVLKASVVGSSTAFEIEKILSVDRDNDLALLRPKSFRGTPLPLADVSRLETGQQIFALGNPRGLEGTISPGIVSGRDLRRIGDATLIQITAPISPGSSGGPVVDSSGAVVGVATLGLRDSQNLNFAVPSTVITKLVSRYSEDFRGSVSANKPPPSGSETNSSAGEDAFWKEVSNSDVEASYQQYLTEYPFGRYRTIAENRIRELVEKADEGSWLQAKRVGTIEAFQTYLFSTDFSVILGGSDGVTEGGWGKYREDATREIERLEREEERAKWLEAETANSLESYANYLESYTSGQWAPLARLRLARLAKISGGDPTNGRGVSPGLLWTNKLGMQFAWVPPKRDWDLVNVCGPPDLVRNRDTSKDCDSSSRNALERVNIEGFWLGIKEVTQSQWLSVMGPGASRSRRCGNCPVENLSIHEILLFIEKLNLRNDGFRYSLPSEQQWMYAHAEGESLDSLRNAGNVLGREPMKEPHKWGLRGMEDTFLEAISLGTGQQYLAIGDLSYVELKSELNSRVGWERIGNLKRPKEVVLKGHLWTRIQIESKVGRLKSLSLRLVARRKK